MKNKNIIIGLIIFLAVLGVSLVFGMVILLNKNIDFSFGFNLGSKNMTLVDTYEEDGKNISKVDLNLYSTDVELKESTNDNLKIEYYSNKETANVIKKDNDRVYIDEEDSHAICIGICSNHRKTIVYLPGNYSGLINISTRSGDIKSLIPAIENELNIVTSSGDVYLKNATLVKIGTSSGDVDIGSAHKLVINTSSGDVLIKELVNNLEVETRSGEIEINKVDQYLKLDTSSGDILIDDLAITNNSIIDTSSGDIKIKDNSSNCYIDFKSNSGDAHINKSDRKSDIVLEVKTRSGDIRVN